MRPILFAAAMITATSVLATSDAMARDYPWCSVDSGDAGGNCSFVTYKHCLATISGIGGCIPNLYAAAPGRPRSIQSSPVQKNLGSAKHDSAKHDSAKAASTKHDSAKPASAKHDSAKPASTKHASVKADSPQHVATMQASAKRASTEHVSAKQVSTNANTVTSTREASTTFIPLPDPALLTPPPEFDCEFKSVGLDDGRAQPQSSTGAQTEPSIDAALRMMLDYERQCYQHAETIVRDRLRRLQTSVGETIKAVNNGH